MRRSDRRAIIFICAVALAFWGGIIVERNCGPSPDPSPVREGRLASSRSNLVPLPNRGGVRGEAAPLPNRGGDGGGAAGGKAADPNTADSATLVGMGFEPWQAHNIIRYRARGGRFRRVEDVKRVYGMTPEQFERVAPHVNIGKRYRPYNEEEGSAERARWDAERAQREEQREARERQYEERQLAREAREQARKDSLAKRFPRQEKFEKLVQLDLNTVDTATLKMVPGIASYRARQIVRYRDRLGGFVSTAQLHEIEGLPADELEAWFKVEGSHVKRIDLNRATVQEMGRHPYIGFTRARAIENYRRNQGTIHSLDDLQFLDGFSAEERKRMGPYVGLAPYNPPVGDEG